MGWTVGRQRRALYTSTKELMMAQSSDFYAVLGVERTADEREITKAYFRLVRQYSPETHPEEFKRIREAYEVLQNPDARKDYDDLTQYGEEIGQHLRSG